MQGSRGPPFFSFTFILQVEGVNGVATKQRQPLFLKHHVIVGDNSSRLSVLKLFLPLLCLFKD
jgi:hypothetical protein